MLIEIKNLVINYPVYSNLKRSFKRKIIDFALAGNITNKDNTTFVNAVNDISFTVNKGDKIGLIGSNGSGKTSLLRAIMGIYEPFSGHVICKETTTSLIDIELGIDEDATGYENIFLRGLILNISKKKINEILPEIEKFSELGEYLNFPVRTYSSGMKVRLAFSILASVQPKIIIMDEWLSVGDQKFKDKASDKLNYMISKSSCLILASHDFDQLKKICNRIIHIEKGKIINELDPKDLK